MNEVNRNQVMRKFMVHFLLAIKDTCGPKLVDGLLNRRLDPVKSKVAWIWFCHLICSQLKEDLL